MIGVLFAKYRLKKANEIKFKSAIDDYYNTDNRLNQSILPSINFLVLYSVMFFQLKTSRI